MIRPSLVGILLLSTSIPQVLGQQYYFPHGEYHAPPADATQIQSLVTPGATLPAQYLAAGTPYPTQYAAQYPTQYTTPYPATNVAPYTTAPGVSYPVPYAEPYVSTYPSTQSMMYQMPDPTTVPQPAVSQADASVPPEEPAAPEAATPEKSGEDAGEEPVLVEEEIPVAWYYAPLEWFDLWEGSVEVGLSGSDGNTQTLNYLLGIDAKRETERDILNFDLKYDRKSADFIETAHRLFSEIRWELLFEDSPWTWYFHETTEYDEFKAFQVRLSYDTGLGRSLIKNDATSLVARAGAGTSHEIGGSNEDLVPEAVFGLEFKHKLNQRQKLSASSEYSPDVTDFLDYRLKSKAAWEVLLDEETNLSLKVSILDRYDSTPGGKRPNDLDYTLTLLWKF